MSVPAAALAPIAVVVVAFEIFSLLDRVGPLPPFASRLLQRGRRIGLLAGRNGVGSASFRRSRSRKTRGLWMSVRRSRGACNGIRPKRMTASCDRFAVSRAGTPPSRSRGVMSRRTAARPSRRSSTRWVRGSSTISVPSRSGPLADTGCSNGIPGERHRDLTAGVVRLSSNRLAVARKRSTSP